MRVYYTADGVDAIVPERWITDKAFKRVDFIEVFAGEIAAV